MVLYFDYSSEMLHMLSVGRSDPGAPCSALQEERPLMLPAPPAVEPCSLPDGSRPGQLRSEAKGLPRGSAPELGLRPKMA